MTQAQVARFLTLDDGHPGSIVRCLDTARNNARARADRAHARGLDRDQPRLAGFRKTVRPPAEPPRRSALLEQVKGETRGFEGAIHRMMRNEATLLIQLGAAIERADNTARLVDVKYHLLLPEGEKVGGVVDRDQWTTILQTVSAVTCLSLAL